MQVHFIIAILFFVALFMAFIEDRVKESLKLALLVGYALVFIILATTKSVEDTADATNYEDMFYNNDDLLVEIATEPTYIYLSRLVLALGGGIGVVFFVYAVVTIPQKLRALNAMTPYIFTALLIYIPVYFEIQDMIQIRTAAAATFLLSAVLALSRKAYLLTALLFVIAVLFHYSAVAYLPFLFIGNRRLGVTWRIILGSLVPIGFAMYFLKLDLFSFIPSSLTEGKLDFYKDSTEKGQWEALVVPYKNPFFLAKCMLLCLCLYFYDYIEEQNPLAPMLINLFAASIFIFLSMATIPVIAGRISDLYGIIDCIVFTFCLYIINPQALARGAIAVVGLYVLVYNMFFTEYFT